MPTIRTALASDALAIAALLHQLGYSVTPDAVPSRLAALEAEDGIALVATDADARAIGVVTGARHTTLHVERPVAYITSLVTDQVSRRHGVGRELVAAIERWAIQGGCSRLSVNSAEHRADAHAFYPQCGFPYSGRRFSKTLLEATS